MTLTIISYGGGVQSTAMLVLATQNKLGIKVDAALFSNVGDDSEHPSTLDYVRNVAQIKSNIPVVELHPESRGIPLTLMELLVRENTPSIPVRFAHGAPAQRSCTRRFKVQVINKWLRSNGATKNNPANVCIGISTDEIQRVNPNRSTKIEKALYPLIDLGLNRSQCQQIIADAGWPVPRKSSCYFCPFHRPQEWSEMLRDEPELFEKSAQLEDTINVKRIANGKDRVFLSGAGIPLRDAIGEAQDMLPLETDWGSCDSGHCMT